MLYPTIKITPIRHRRFNLIDRTQMKNLIINNKKHIVKTNEFAAEFYIPHIRAELLVLPANPIRKFKLGWTVEEKIGIGIINMRAINFPPKNLISKGRSILNKGRWIMVDG